MSPTVPKNSSPANKPLVRDSIIARFLLKLAKHMALLSCLMIAGTATGRTSVGSFGIFLMIVAASLTHLLGRARERRAAAFVRLPHSGP